MKLHKIYFAAAAAAICLTSCDNISEDDRYIPVEGPTIERKVLVQEFTGQACVNCPDGAATIHALQNTYPGAVIAVCFHPEDTPFTTPLFGIDLGLTNPQATEYYNYYRPNGFPAAIINGGAIQYNIANWSAEVRDALGVAPSCDVDVNCNFDATTKKLTANWEVKYNQSVQQPCSVLLWIYENKIVGPQLSNSEGTIFQYEHNHVFRQSMNSLWGEKIGESFLPGQSFNGSSSVTLDSGWKPENLHVVAFVFQTSSRRVEQAEETPVIAEN